jgi:hypothetical protein
MSPVLWSQDNFKEEAIDMAYVLHGINPGRLYATYFAGNGGLVV